MHAAGDDEEGNFETASRRTGTRLGPQRQRGPIRAAGASVYIPRSKFLWRSFYILSSGRGTPKLPSALSKAHMSRFIPIPESLAQGLCRTSIESPSATPLPANSDLPSSYTYKLNADILAARKT